MSYKKSAYVALLSDTLNDISIATMEIAGSGGYGMNKVSEMGEKVRFALTKVNSMQGDSVPEDEAKEISDLVSGVNKSLSELLMDNVSAARKVLIGMVAAIGIAFIWKTFTH